MMDNNDVFLVIVGDGSEELQIPSQIQIKEECEEFDENVPVEELIEKAEKHGQYIKLEIQPKTEFKTLDHDKSQFTPYLNIKIEEPDYLDSDEIVSDNECLSEEVEKKAFECGSVIDLDEHESYGEDVENRNRKSKRKTKNQTKPFKNGRRSFMLGPDEQKSFVEELRNRNPELRKNTKLLVEMLSDIMRNVGRPPLPKCYFVQHDKTFDCPQCGHQSETLPAAGRHYQEKHGPRYLVCYACGVDFRSTTNLYKHEKRCISRDRRIVLMARAAILGNKGRGRPYLKPSAKVKNIPRFQCDECPAIFRSKCALMSHLSLHRGERMFQCHECLAAYTSSSALARHVKKHTNIEFICDHCQKSFKLKVALVAHMDTHRPVRKFGCELCDRRFAQKQALRLHVDRVHRNLPPPHACQICPKRYPRTSLLKNHMKREHGLTIMTPKMFFKKLPTLSKAEMEATAKIIFKTNPQMVNEYKMNSLDNANNEPGKDQDNFILPDNPTTEEIIEYCTQMPVCEQNIDGVKTLIFKSGEVLEIHYSNEQ